MTLYCHQSAQPLVLQVKTFPSLTIRYVTGTVTTQPPSLDPSQLNLAIAYRLILLFSVGVTVGSFVHFHNHCYFFMSAKSVTPALCVSVRRSLDDDINEAQS